MVQIASGSDGLRTARRSLLTCLLLGGGVAVATGAKPELADLRFGMSQKLLVGVNQNDAKAAFLVWGNEILAATGFHLINQEFILPTGRLQAGIRDGSLDLVVMTTPEYPLVRTHLDTTRIISDESGGEELLLLVKDGGPVTDFTQLHGRSLIIQDHPLTSMSMAWLSLSLWKEGLAGPDKLFRSITRNTKLSQVVLPVFFGQADACVTSRVAFATMTELNPQLARKLKVLVASPPIVNAFVACRKDYPGNLKQRLVNRLLELRAGVTTKQLLTLFQSTAYKAFDEDHLRPTLAMLDAFEKYASHGVPAKGARP